MKNIKIIWSLLLVLPFMFSCEKYEDYVLDYDYSAVYFATQQPIRTVVAREVMQFKFGIALGGKRENTVNETVTYMIDPELLDSVELVGANTFTLLPEEYYTLSNASEFVVEKGSFIGDVTLTINRALFTADPLSITNTYALPVRITQASVDSVLAEHDYSIIVVKYQSPYHGVYYSKGAEYELDGTGAHVDTVLFYNKDLSQNMTKSFSTLELNSISTNKISADRSGTMDLTIAEDGSVEIATSAITVSENSSIYEADGKTIIMDYKFENGGTMFHTVDTLVLRQDPELDLRFEEWEK